MKVIDVRTREEFMGGHVVDSINIPLNELPNRISELQNLSAPIVLCCASGNRSAQGVNFLQNQGISCENGGSWLEVNARV
ncbi:MAG: sulfurtransferase [Bacteroidetes bacterium MedPE-SWsnd-G2]|nr:MAG: sulfurtransferase [Bacteroidetes bacterium MedPE-SWsnd-G2]